MRGQRQAFTAWWITKVGTETKRLGLTLMKWNGPAGTRLREPCSSRVVLGFALLPQPIPDFELDDALRHTRASSTGALRSITEHFAPPRAKSLTG